MRIRLLIVAGWLAALMITLCLGGLWAVLSMLLGAGLPWFALLIGAATWLARPYLYRSRPWVSALVLPTVAWIGMFYAQVLIASMLVAQAFDVPVLDTLSRMGLVMALDLAWIRLASSTLLFMVMGSALAAWIGWRHRGAVAQTSQSPMPAKA